MFNKKQVSAIIKLLKDKSIEYREPLKKVFEEGGKLWATNGYVVFELGEVEEENANTCIPLAKLVGWAGTHKSSDVCVIYQLLEKNQDQAPLVSGLVGEPSDFVEPTSIKGFNVNYLKLATDFLGAEEFGLRVGKKKEDLYQVVPIVDKGGRASDVRTYTEQNARAYVMGLA